MAKLKQLVGIDIGTYSIKLIEIKGNQVTNFAYREIDPTLEGEERRIAWKQNIEGILSTLKLRTHIAILLFSSPHTYIRNVSYPHIPEEDLWLVMEKDAKLHLPPSQGKVVFDFSLREEKEESREYQIVYCDENEVSERKILLEELGFKVFSVIPAPYSLSYFISGRNGGGLKAILDIGASSSTLAINKNGKLQIGIQVSIGGNEFTRAIAGSLNIPFLQAEELKKKENFLSQSSRVYPSISKAVEQLSEEVKLGLNYYSQQFHGEKIEEILISGGGSKLKNIDSVLKEKLGIRLRNIESQGNIDISSLRPDRKEYFQELFPQFIPLLGASTGYIELPNLVRRSLEKRKKEEKARLITLSFILGLISVSILSFSPLLVKSFLWNSEIKITSGKVKELLPVVQEVRRVEEKKKNTEERISFLKESIQSKGKPLEKFAQILSLSMPDGVWLNNMEYSGENKIILQGSSLSGEKVGILLENLRKTPFIESQIINIEKRGENNLSDFQMKVLMK